MEMRLGYVRLWDKGAVSPVSSSFIFPFSQSDSLQAEKNLLKFAKPFAATNLKLSTYCLATCQSAQWHG